MTKGQFFLAVPLILVLAAGCGKSSNTPAKVTGKVTYKGAPVTAGTVAFQPKEGGAMHSASIEKDGSYTLNELPVGDMAVTVETESAHNNKDSTKGGNKQYSKGGGSPMPEGFTPGGGDYVKIPKKYSDPKTTPLTHSVVKGTQTFPIDLAD